MTLPAPLQPLYRYMGSREGLHLDAQLVRRTGRSLFGYLYSLDTNPDLRMFTKQMRERRHSSKRLALATIGHKSGKLHTIAISYGHEPDGSVVLVGSAGGSEKEPHWVTNLRATPIGWIWIDRKRTPVRATVLEGPDKAEVWARVIERAPIYAKFQSETARDIPVILLRPYRDPTLL